MVIMLGWPVPDAQEHELIEPTGGLLAAIVQCAPGARAPWTMSQLRAPRSTRDSKRASTCASSSTLVTCCPLAAGRRRCTAPADWADMMSSWSTKLAPA